MYVIVKHNYMLQHKQGKIEKYHYAAHVIATHSSSPGDLMIKEKYIQIQNKQISNHRQQKWSQDKSKNISIIYPS